MRTLNSHCLCHFIVIVIKSAQYAVIWSTLLLFLACSFLPLILSFLWMTFYSFVSFDFFVSFFLVAIFSMLGSVLIVCLSVLFFFVVWMCLFLDCFALFCIDCSFYHCMAICFSNFVFSYRGMFGRVPNEKAKVSAFLSRLDVFALAWFSFRLCLFWNWFFRGMERSFLVFHSSRIKFWIFWIQ